MQGTDESAVDAEAALQRDLARKLGMPKKKQKGNVEADPFGEQIHTDGMLAILRNRREAGI